MLPLVPVFDPEAQTRSDLTAEGCFLLPYILIKRVPRIVLATELHRFSQKEIFSFSGILRFLWPYYPELKKSGKYYFSFMSS
jgi:hypothetical protein